MKYSSVILVLLLSVLARVAVSSDIDNKMVVKDNGDRQFYLPSGASAVPVAVTDDGKKKSDDTKAGYTAPVNKGSAERIKKKWGVGEFRVRQTSAGYMLDVRYRVYDKDKAKPLFDRKVRPFAIAEESGIKYGVPASPKVGFLRQAPQHVKENRQYFFMIANPGRGLKTGDKLTLVIGDFRIEHLTVE